MAKQEELKKALEIAPRVVSIFSLIESKQKELQKALPDGMNAARMVRIAQTSVSLNSELANLPPESNRSLLGAIFTLAQIGLEPVAGQAYLMPFKNKDKVEVQAVIGYKGLKELFYRHSSAVSLDMHIVKANDEFAYQYGSNAFINHREAKGDRGETVGYYAIAKLKGGGELFRYMSKEDAMEHGRRHSRSFKSEFSPWQKEPDAMCLKTVIIQLAKLLPMSVDLQRAISADETIRDYRPGVAPLDIPAKEWEAVDEETGEVIPPPSPEDGPIPY